MFFKVFSLCALLSATICSFGENVAAHGDVATSGKAVLTVQEESNWWSSLSESKQEELIDLFDPEWFNAQTKEVQISYCCMAQSLYDFLANPELDSRPDDSYTGFAPLLLRASFHAAGTFHAPSGTGGTNGGSIFTPGELEDGQNACIEPAVEKMQALFRGSPRVSLADAMVIGGSVALHTMDFPRMDLLRISGGRTEVAALAWRDRLPNPDFNPSELFTESYGMTPSEFTALIGGGHNFGSAHGVCSGYVGDWTKNPKSWKSVDDPEGSEFFVDLLEEDWRWYEVCTFKNATSVFTSIPDPFAFIAVEEEEHEEEEEENVCEVHHSEIPFICESQAMRGCDFEDGAYPPNNPSIIGCQFRLKSDFFLKADPGLRPLSVSFAEDDDLLAEEFGKAYHKLTHAGLSRCGLSGFGCGEGGVCKNALDVHGHYLSSYCEIESATAAAVTDGIDSAEALDEADDSDEDGFSLGSFGSVIALVAIAILALVVVVLMVKLNTVPTTTTSNASVGSGKTATLEQSPTFRDEDDMNLGETEA